jgi:hypothetical protein
LNGIAQVLGGRVLEQERLHFGLDGAEQELAVIKRREKH